MNDQRRKLQTQPTETLPSYPESRSKDKKLTEVHSFIEKFQLQEHLPKVPPRQIRPS